MSDFLSTKIAAWISIGMVALGVGAAVWILIGDEDSGLHQQWNKYVRKVEEEVKFLFIRKSASTIAKTQIGVFVGCLVIAQLTGSLLFILIGVMALILPLAWLKSQRAKRVLRIEEQLDGWLLLLANSLKATPAIGEAIKQTVNLVQPPIQQELDLIVKENQLGTPLDQAVLNAGNRIESALVGGSFSMLVVARQTGGDLPTILETSAGSLREMARLEGVVRTKTAEGKGQVWVLGSMPWLMAGALSAMDETWWPTLSQTFTGNLVLVVAFFAWSVAILWGRNILAVDI